MKLEPSQIHVWFSDLDVEFERNAARFESLLSKDERERAASFHFDIHRSRYVAARAKLRLLLAGYLGRRADDLTFVYGINGKPELDGKPLHFNVSHSEAGGLFAFTCTAPVGVDLERVRALPDMLQIARRFFSPAEAAAILEVPEEERTTAFFRIWTRKEAFIKATGEGLSCPLDCFDVSPGEPPAVLRVAGDSAAPKAWTLHHIAPAAGYLGAVAIRRPGCGLVVL
jgi:4'-phosphopantetheinyl transferase